MTILFFVFFYMSKGEGNLNLRPLPTFYWREMHQPLNQILVGVLVFFFLLFSLFFNKITYLLIDNISVNHIFLWDPKSNFNYVGPKHKLKQLIDPPTVSSIG